MIYDKCNAPYIFVGYIDRGVKTSRKSVADAQADRRTIW